MARAFLHPAGQRALAEAVRTLEGGSSAELVIAVRGRSGSYLAADLIVGAIGALITLAFLLFSPFPFGLIWFLIDPLLVAALCVFLSSRLPPVRRLLTPKATRDMKVRMAAEALFHDRGVHNTQGRTGILLYLSLLERRAEFIADTGVLAQVPPREWHTACLTVDSTMARGGDSAVVAATLPPLGILLAHHLPRQIGDRNELPDELDSSR